MGFSPDNWLPPKVGLRDRGARGDNKDRSHSVFANNLRSSRKSLGTACIPKEGVTQGMNTKAEIIRAFVKAAYYSYINQDSSHSWTWELT
jgi:hypothetical protein